MYNLDLPVGQLVVIHDANFGIQGQLAVIAGPYDLANRQYQVRLQTTDLESSPEEVSRSRMAAEYGVDDLVGMTQGQLLDIWHHFGLPTSELNSPDAYLTQAMTFLQPERPRPQVLSADSVRPLIADAAELPELRRRHEASSRQLSTTQLGQLATQGPTATLTIPDDPDLAAAIAASLRGPPEAGVVPTASYSVPLTTSSQAAALAAEEQRSRALAAIERRMGPITATAQGAHAALPDPVPAHSAASSSAPIPTELEAPAPTCTLCNELIRGHVERRDGGVYHFGCAMSLE